MILGFINFVENNKKFDDINDWVLSISIVMMIIRILNIDEKYLWSSIL